jgi:hypothetical protein
LSSSRVGQGHRDEPLVQRPATRSRAGAPRARGACGARAPTAPWAARTPDRGVIRCGGGVPSAPGGSRGGGGPATGAAAAHDLEQRAVAPEPALVPWVGP